MKLNNFCKLFLFAALVAANTEVTQAGNSEVRAQRREHNRRHGELLKEFQETTSESRRKVLEQELTEARKKKGMLKYMSKGHSEETASRIVDLEQRLHALQDKRDIHAQSNSDRAERRAEMKAIRADLSRLKFPTEQQKQHDQLVNDAASKANIRNAKQLRARAKELRAQIRTTTDPAEKQLLRAQLDALYE